MHQTFRGVNELFPVLKIPTLFALRTRKIALAYIINICLKNKNDGEKCKCKN